MLDSLYAPKERVTYKCNVSFLPVEVVVIQGIGLSDPASTCSVHEPLFSSAIVWSSTSRASYLLYRVTWEGGMGKGAVACHPKCRLVFIHPFSLTYCLQLGGGRIQDSFDLGVLQAAFPVQCRLELDPTSLLFLMTP